MKYIFIILILQLPLIILNAQIYTDYVGAGNNKGIEISSSNNLTKTGWGQSASGDKTMSGDGLEGKLVDASRFLSQATLGASWKTIKQVSEMKFEDWIDQQFDLPPTLILPELIETFNLTYQIYLNNGGEPGSFIQNPEWQHFDYAWWQLNMTNEDLLRQRIALALSEILVISVNSDLDDYGVGLGDYYDILIRNAFGNYEDILLEVSLHPSMGVYLSHLNNPKANPDRNIHPDENYAREVMQLFSIGLFELNLDGSRKTDSNGNYIPTYNNEDIKEFAKVFTGLGAGGVVLKDDFIKPDFNLNIINIDFSLPMKIYDEWHETSEKQLLNGFIIPANQNGILDIKQTINHLFNHPNVGPFLSKRLIQMLIKSNPTPEYIERIAKIFNDNGQGIRGDMKSIIKGILLDDEARKCEWVKNPFQGKLKEPIIRYTQFAKAIGTNNPLGLFWNIGNTFQNNVGQHPLHSPSVFNFYLPDFQPNGPIAEQELIAPEYQIHNTRTSIGYVNEVNEWAVEGNLLNSQNEYGISSQTDYSQFIEIAKDPDVLINKLDVLLTYGQLSEETKGIIKEAIIPFEDNSIGNQNRIKLALYLIMISPDYNVLK